MKIALDGGDIDVSEEGQGKALVLLHAFALSKSTWDAQAERLAVRAHVIRIDLRGMGASSVPGGPYLTETLAGDVVGVMDALDIETATIVGHSYSVGVAFEFYRMFAERVAGLGVVCGSAAAADRATAEQYRDAADALEREGMTAVLGTFGPRYVGSSARREHPHVWRRVSELLAATSPEGAAATLRGMALRGGSEDLLPEIGVPVAVIAGTEDELAPIEALRATANALPNATFDALACGHVPSLELPDATTAILERLVQRVPSFEPASDT